MKPLVLGILLALTSALGAQELSYDQLAAMATKTVVETFLLCPDIQPDKTSGRNAGITLAEGPSDPAAAALSLWFRQQLLEPGRMEDGITIASVLIDKKNGYLRIEGTQDGGRAFNLVFVYFEDSQKHRLPALTFHTEAREDTADHLRFYRLEGNAWKVLPRSQLFPEFSTQSLVPFVGTGDASNVIWVADLPRYGTTVRFLPRTLSDYDDVSEDAKAYRNRVEGYALECSWNKAAARFEAPKPAVANPADVPQTKAVAADFFPLLRPDLEGARRLRDQWRANKANPADDFEYRGGGAEASRIHLKILGQYRGLPLVAELDSFQDEAELSLWLYHPDSGLREPSGLRDLLETTDYAKFYKASRKAEANAAQRLVLQYGLDSGHPGVTVRLDTSHWADNPDPDFRLVFVWDEKSGGFLKTARPDHD